MLELPDIFNILQSVTSLKMMAYFLTLFCFGLVVICLGYSKRKNISHWFGVFIKTLWILALASLAVYGGLEWALPTASPTTQLITGFCFVLGVATLSMGQNMGQKLILFPITGVVIFLCFALTVFLEYALQSYSASRIAPNILFRSWDLLGAQGKFILGAHLITALVSVGVLILSSCTAGLYLWIYKNLKTKTSPQDLFSLPSLGRLENITTKLSFVGLLFMTASLLSGIWLVFIEFPLTSTLMAKILWAFLIWGWFAISIFAKDVLDLYGKRGAWFYILGGIVLLSGFILLSTLDK